METGVTQVLNDSKVLNSLRNSSICLTLIRPCHTRYLPTSSSVISKPHDEMIYRVHIIDFMESN